MADDAHIVEALRQDAPGAVDTLVETYGNRLLRSAYLLCGSEADAQDIVQDTLIAAIKSIGKFRGASALYTWLHGILINYVRHFFRDRKQYVSLDDIPEQADPRNDLAEVEQKSTRSAIMQALDTISPDHREIIILRYFEELTLPEITARLGLRTGTVKSRLHYALSNLRKILPPELNPCGDNGHV